MRIVQREEVVDLFRNGKFGEISWCVIIGICAEVQENEKGKEDANSYDEEERFCNDIVRVLGRIGNGYKWDDTTDAFVLVLGENKSGKRVVDFC